MLGSHSGGALSNLLQTLCGSLFLWGVQEKAEEKGLGPWDPGGGGGWLGRLAWSEVPPQPGHPAPLPHIGCSFLAEVPGQLSFGSHTQWPLCVPLKTRAWKGPDGGGGGGATWSQADLLASAGGLGSGQGRGLWARLAGCLPWAPSILTLAVLEHTVPAPPGYSPSFY